MKYLCLAYGDQKKMSTLSKEQFEALVARCKLHDAELHASGHFVESSSLEWDCTTIRARDGKTVVTDGPFVETKEHLGGFAVVEVADDAAARYWAGRIAVAVGWPQEVHRFPHRAGVLADDQSEAASTV